MLLKLSTAANRMVFMADSADHVTGKTGLTLTITASKDGAAFASITPTVTERGSGWYALALTTTHTNTLGALAYHVTAAGADPADFFDQVAADLPGASVASVTSRVTANVDRIGGDADAATGLQNAGTTYFGLGVFGAKVDSISNNVITPASIQTGAFTAAKFAANAITSTVAPLLANLDATVTSRQATFTTSTGVTLPAAVASPTNITAASGVAVGSLGTGVITTASINDGAITEAKIATPAEATGQPTGILGMIRRLFESSPWGNKRVRLRTTGSARLRNAADSADLVSVTQSSTTVGSDTTDTQTKGV